MNSKNSILLVDPAFDAHSAHLCSLLIKVSADNFSYAIIDPVSAQLKVLYDQQECENPIDDLSEKLENDQYLSMPFKQVKASFFTLNTIAVPNEFYSPEQANNYGKYFTAHQSKTLHSKPTPFNLTSVFTLDPLIERNLSSKFPQCKFYDHVSPLLSMAEQITDHALVLDFTVGSVNAAYFENGNLLFQNSFEIADAEEFNYYLLFMVKQLNIDMATTNIYLSGIVHEGDKIHEIIKKYFKSLSFNIPINSNLDLQVIEELPAHYYSNLLALDLCV